MYDMSKRVLYQNLRDTKAALSNPGIAKRFFWARQALKMGSILNFEKFLA